MRPLDGLVVLDLTRLLPGAVASLTLSNFGADVIKVEEPSAGDYARHLPPFVGGEGAFFVATNYGKRSVALDLKEARGRDALLRMASRADVLLEGFRPGVMARLGLGYEELRRRNQRLVYASLTGYGQAGRHAAAAGHDINYLALGGVLGALAAGRDRPRVPGVQVADLYGGAAQAVIGILLALAARSKTGRGQAVDVSMTDGAMRLLTIPLAEHAASVGGDHNEGGDAAGDEGAAGDILSGRYACYNLYETRDGRWLSVGALEPKFWAALCRAVGLEELIQEQFAGGDDRQARAVETLARAFKSRDADDWLALFGDEDVCVAPVNSLDEALDSRHFRERGTFESVPHPRAGDIDLLGVAPKLTETPGRLSHAPPPRLGEHTREVLLWAGLPAEEVEELERARVVKT